jgi:hemerythrin superfamily protein
MVGTQNPSIESALKELLYCDGNHRVAMEHDLIEKLREELKWDNKPYLMNESFGKGYVALAEWNLHVAEQSLCLFKRNILVHPNLYPR